MALRPTVTVSEIIGAWGVGREGRTGATFTVIRVALPPDTSGDAFVGAHLATLRSLLGYVEFCWRTVAVAEQDVPLPDDTLPDDTPPDATGDADRPVRVQRAFLALGAEGTVLSFRCPVAVVARRAVPVGTMVGSFTVQAVGDRQ